MTPTESLKEEFFSAVMKGDLPPVAAFVEKYPDAVHWRHGIFSATALASCSRSLQMTEFLLKNGADANARDIDGDTPLMWEAINKRVDTITTLMDHGADADATNKKGQTAIDKANMNRFTSTNGFSDVAAAIFAGKERQAAARAEKRKKQNLETLRRGLPRGFKIPTPLE